MRTEARRLRERLEGAMIVGTLPLVAIPVLFIVASVFVGGALWRAHQRRATEADARRRVAADLALRLAADLGAARPTVASADPRFEWRIRLGEGTDVLVADRVVEVRRAQNHPTARAVMIHSSRLLGRSQEDYALARILVPDGEGWWASPGPSGDAPTLTSWEASLVFADLAKRMADLGVISVAADASAIRTAVGGAPHADVVRGMAELLSEIAGRVEAT